MYVVSRVFLVAGLACVSRGAACGQHVIGPNSVVAQYLRGDRSDEDCPVVRALFGHLAGLRSVYLQMFRTHYIGYMDGCTEISAHTSETYTVEKRERVCVCERACVYVCVYVCVRGREHENSLPSKTHSICNLHTTVSWHSNKRIKNHVYIHTNKQTYIHIRFIYYIYLDM